MGPIGSMITGESNMLTTILKIPVLLAAAALIALPVTGMSQNTKGGEKGTATVPVAGGKGPVSAETLISRYTTLAGSEANAKSLVNGLRSGTTVTLTFPAERLIKQESGRARELA